MYTIYNPSLIPHSIHSNLHCPQFHRIRISKSYKSKVSYSYLSCHTLFLPYPHHTFPLHIVIERMLNLHRNALLPMEIRTVYMSLQLLYVHCYTFYTTSRRHSHLHHYRTEMLLPPTNTHCRLSIKHVPYNAGWPTFDTAQLLSHQCKRIHLHWDIKTSPPLRTKSILLPISSGQCIPAGPNSRTATTGFTTSH